MTPAQVFDVTATDFQTEVLQRSVETPVLLDFWADWCAPCKTLTPILEKLAAEYGGSFVLGKVDAEAEAELSHAFQVRSLPFVVLLVGGRPVDGFTGALPEAEVRAFLLRYRIEPAAAAAAAESPDSPEGRLAAAKRAVGAGDLAAARDALSGIEDEAEQAGERDRLLEGIAVFDEQLDPQASSAAAALARGRDALRQQRATEALEAFLESLQHDRGYRGGLARKAMLLTFALLGDDDETSIEYRRRLATLLY